MTKREAIEHLLGAFADFIVAADPANLYLVFGQDHWQHLEDASALDKLGYADAARAVRRLGSEGKS